MNDNTSINLAQSLRANAQKQYNEAYSAARETIIEAVRGHFGGIQRQFQKQKALPENAYSRYFTLSDEILGPMFRSYMLDSLLTELGFTKGEHYVPDERLATSRDYSWSRIYIPEVEENTTLSVAQTIYNEHVAVMEAIKQDIIQIDTVWVHQNYPDAIPFAQEFVKAFKEGSFSNVELSHEPGLLTYMITLNTPESLHKLSYESYSKHYAHVRRFIYHVFEKEGVTEENGFSNIYFGFCDPNYAKYSNFRTRITITVPFSTEQNTID